MDSKLTRSGGTGRDFQNVASNRKDDLRNRDESTLFDSYEFMFHRLCDWQPRGDAFEPLRYVRIVRNVHAIVLKSINARERYDISYRIVIGKPIASAEMTIHGIELFLCALFKGGIICVLERPQRRQHVGCMKHRPFEDVGMIGQRSQKPAGFLSQVEANSYGFEYDSRPVAWPLPVDQCRNFSEGIDPFIGCCLLFSFVNVDRMKREG